MTNTKKLEAAITRLNNIEPKPDDLKTVINQGCVLMAMATDIEHGHVPATVSVEEFNTAVEDFCQAVDDFFATNLQDETK